MNPFAAARGNKMAMQTFVKIPVPFVIIYLFIIKEETVFLSSMEVSYRNYYSQSYINISRN